MWLPSYLLGNWALVLTFVLVVAALGAIAFFARNWKAVIAALVVAALGFSLQWMDRNGYKRAIAEQHEREIKTLKGRIATLEKLGVEDAKRALDDADYIDKLRKQADETPVNNGDGLDRDAVSRVRRIR